MSVSTEWAAHYYLLDTLVLSILWDSSISIKIILFPLREPVSVFVKCRSIFGSVIQLLSRTAVTEYAQTTVIWQNIRSTRTVVVKVKYVSSTNLVAHTENCKLDIPLNCSVKELEKT